MKSANEIVKELLRNHTLSYLGELNTNENELIGVLLSKEKYELNDDNVNEIAKEIQEMQMEKHCTESKTMSDPVPPVSLVKRLLGLEAAENYRSLLERAENRDVYLDYKEPYLLVNKNRLKKIIDELSELVD